jgi:hypothetical protein
VNGKTIGLIPESKIDASSFPVRERDTRAA